ncbi:MAG TPA: hypothetical protein VOB72_18685 [Candidatus Dormibacteraeota bacterium]|nr:hypothetical protein [Candidatus Dormibacteraeota bacterium]
MALIESLAQAPQRLALAAGPLPDIQFDIGNFIAPAFTVNGVLVRFGPVFTYFVPARLTRNPTKSDQTVLANALNRIEQAYAFSPSGIFTFVAYGLPYFNRLPGSLVTANMPKVNGSFFPVLQEAVASPTDVVAGNGITKDRFNVAVRIESNDLLFTLRSDTRAHLDDVLNWLKGSNRLNGATVTSPAFNGLLSFQTTRFMFQQNGLPRNVANANNLPFAGRVNPQSPMWMGFADQQVAGSGPAAICTFVGNASAATTNARAGDYFDNGSIQHLSHDILDLVQFYALPSQDPPDGETFEERVQYMFRSNPLPSHGNTDQFTDGGGPAFLENTFQGVNDAFANATGQTETGAPRLGHESCLQRSSRAGDGTPMHIRMDGTGFDNMDVPDGSNQPKLQFTVFVPNSDFFRVMRVNQASLDFQQAFAVPEDDNGLERFMTATRRQNFLVPPRRHRAFPLLELT